MPPPGTRVIKDTKVLVGDKAVTRGRLLMAIALLLVSLGLAGGLYLPYKLGKAFGEQIRQTTSDVKQTKGERTR
jgi:Na+/phosphate symporter